jgi:hypothetical protein
VCVHREDGVCRVGRSARLTAQPPATVMHVVLATYIVMAPAEEWPARAREEAAATTVQPLPPRLALQARP